MRLLNLTITLLAVSIMVGIVVPNAFAQLESMGGGVDKEGTWYVGENLKKGDFFSYKVCHAEYKDCSEIRFDFWIKGDIVTSGEEKWLALVVVYDGLKVVKGTMELGKVAPEPTGGTDEIAPYRSVFKTSIAWMSAYATAPVEGAEGPKAFSDVSWGKIGNIGGQQVTPRSIETVKTSAGTFEDVVLVNWRTGGYENKVWVLDEFPFPIKANTFVHVPTGIPPQEYRFELLDYKQNVSEDPFTEVMSTAQMQAMLDCPQESDWNVVKGTTSKSEYVIQVQYRPHEPLPGCQIEWFIDFKNKFNIDEYLNQVQYDIFVVDDELSLPPLRSIANEEGRQFLYSGSGQVHKFTTIMEEPGIAHYVIWVYGLSPDYQAPDQSQQDFKQFDIMIGEPKQEMPTMPDTPAIAIPEWIKNNAGWWANGQIDDNSFVQGIQYMIKEGIMKIPPTAQGEGTGGANIPDWIKNNAGWWANGQIDDNSFVQGIQYLIKEGIMTIE